MGSSGYRITFRTIDILKNKVFWTTMEEDLKSFLKSYLHCVSTARGFLIPRPIREAVHGDTSNVVHFDYFYMTNTLDGLSYVLVLKDYFSSYCVLDLMKTAYSQTTADAIIDLCKGFGKPRVQVSDQESHLKNILVSFITEVLGINHHFTLTYFPWSHGTVERLIQDVLCMSRCLLSEFCLQVTDWPGVLQIVQMALNSSLLERFNGI